MRIRFATLAWLVVLGAIGSLTFSLTHGQDIPPAPPTIKRSPKPLVVAPPRSAPEPAVAKSAAIDLSRWTPLQKEMYLAARRAAGWLDRMNDVKGRFLPGLHPSLNLALEGDHALRQAGAAYALARAARFLDDAGSTAHARQALLGLLQNTVTDAGKQARHSVLPSAVINRLSYAALTVLTIHELSAPEADLLAKSDQLCEFLRRQQRADGSFRCREPIEGAREQDDAEEVRQFPGQALYALMRSQEHRPAAWKTEAVRKALPYYRKWWPEHRSREFAHWYSAAFTEAYLLTKERAFAEAVLEMNDWVCGLQYQELDPAHPQWFGGFRNGEAGSAPNVTSAVCTEALADGCRVARQLGNAEHHKRYLAALERGLQFLTTLQYTEADTQHFADWYRPRLVGGFHFSHQDGNLRIEQTQHALCALVQYLRMQ